VLGVLDPKILQAADQLRLLADRVLAEASESNISALRVLMDLLIDYQLPLIAINPKGSPVPVSVSNELHIKHSQIIYPDRLRKAIRLLPEGISWLQVHDAQMEDLAWSDYQNARGKVLTVDSVEAGDGRTEFGEFQVKVLDIGLGNLVIVDGFLDPPWDVDVLNRSSDWKRGSTFWIYGPSYS
jgi:hypothetical protein